MLNDVSAGEDVDCDIATQNKKGLVLVWVFVEGCCVIFLEYQLSHPNLRFVSFIQSAVRQKRRRRCHVEGCQGELFLRQYLRDAREAVLVQFDFFQRLGAHDVLFLVLSFPSVQYFQNMVLSKFLLKISCPHITTKLDCGGFCCLLK